MKLHSDQPAVEPTLLRAMLCRGMASRPSVRPSVCLSVCLFVCIMWRLCTVDLDHIVLFFWKIITRKLNQLRSSLPVGKKQEDHSEILGRIRMKWIRNGIVRLPNNSTAFFKIKAFNTVSRNCHQLCHYNWLAYVTYWPNSNRQPLNNAELSDPEDQCNVLESGHVNFCWLW